MFRIALVSLGIALMVATSAHAENVRPKDAGHYVGVHSTIEGEVSQVSRSGGGTTFINFGGRFPNHVFYGVIFRDHADQFPDVFALEGRTIVIEGEVQVYKGKPQIILTSPSQIHVR
ncbi:nucleotide-binding protein [Silicimonas algicola]|uniref:Nucleotide-binding protein n=1 Tax=Silicimonas algicola TaxID=1826607 RepID=A0A316G5W9_9RHOB|nr:OB-fold nucleic acid binding domain-containing protein [Silicimonas algicola]AZQ68675.1 nucleotide-binding protein [Silicimonas algicola]PWK56258.1 hypothetical protein C8D95_105326 [Silicimonas algicola]